VLTAHAAGKPIAIWFQDEARIGQKGTLTRLWADAARAQGRLVIIAMAGSTCSGPPARCGPPGRLSFCPLPRPRRWICTSKPPAVIVMSGAHAVIVMDGAGYHQRIALNLHAAPLGQTSQR
jgi:hypothetical protein